jgi:hypothetical protein
MLSYAVADAMKFSTPRSRPRGNSFSLAGDGFYVGSVDCTEKQSFRRGSCDRNNFCSTCAIALNMAALEPAGYGRHFAYLSFAVTAILPESDEKVPLRYATHCVATMRCKLSAPSGMCSTCPFALNRAALEPAEHGRHFAHLRSCVTAILRESDERVRSAIQGVAAS